MAALNTHAALYRVHRTALVDYARDIVGSRSQAEDVVQEAWLRLDDAARGRAIADPLRYLYRIVRNLAFDVLRRSRLERSIMGADIADLAEVLADDVPAADHALIVSSELEIVLAALRDLPQRTRVAFEMHRLGGYKLKDIAAHLGISVGLAHALVAEAIAHCSECRDRASR